MKFRSLLTNLFAADLIKEHAVDVDAPVQEALIVHSLCSHDLQLVEVLELCQVHHERLAILSQLLRLRSTLLNWIAYELQRHQICWKLIQIIKCLNLVVAQVKELKFFQMLDIPDTSQLIARQG